MIDRLGGRRVPSENFHVTLCFVGNVADEDVARLCAAAASVKGSASTLTFRNLEYWARPEILCAVADRTPASEPARALSDALARAVTAAGFSPDIKPFRPHLTLVRKDDRVRAREIECPRQLSAELRVRSEAFVLLQSRRGASGSVYSVVESLPLYRNRGE